ncbi:YIP1 family protein [Paenibacillus cymbidii]|uniref:YIP1 family protein n=1 Tax=Paenibacillus cymbidii TaxID=1639034 RepID=UPI001F24F60C|nr:YIP1 family protein [Paenibacillus cymbidii]
MTIRRRWLPLFAALLVLMAAAPPHASADVAYNTNFIDQKARNLSVQPAYTPIGIAGDHLTIESPAGQSRNSPLQNPKDLFIGPDDHLYIADTGNNRIVELDANGNQVRFLTVPESPLKKPEGLFVTKAGEIYIADTGNKRIVRLHPDGTLAKVYTRPDSRYIPASYPFDPVRLVVDTRGFLYIAMLGSYQGVLQLNPEGRFQSFYGANKTPLSPIDALKRTFYPRQMYANESSKLPDAISSLAMDRDGFIYTSTRGVTSVKNTVKKLNIRGVNMLHSRTGNFGTIRVWERKYESGRLVLPALIDLTVDVNGNITAIDSIYHYVYQYDANGNPLFFWGGPAPVSTTQLGLLKTPVAIDANSRGDLYILDGQDGLIHILRLSEFGALVNRANQLTLQGRYEESERPWQEVLQHNAYFTPAILGQAKAAYKTEDYARAARLFIKGEDPVGYSDSLWQIRLLWFQRHFAALATGLLAAALGIALLGWWSRRNGWRAAWRSRSRSRIPAIVQFKHVWHLLRHPIDGFTAIRYERKGSYRSALTVLAAVSLSLVCMNLFTGYSFNTVNTRSFDVISYLLRSGAIWFGWVLAHYFVSTIYQGEGRFKDVFIGSAYALIPIVLIGLPLALASNGLTLAEQSIYSFFQNGMSIWIFLLLFWMIMSVHNYTFGETIVNLVLSAAAFATLAVLVFIILGIGSDLYIFITDVTREVYAR